MDYDIDPKILEEIRRLSLSSDVKFNRFFGDLSLRRRMFLRPSSDTTSPE